MPWLCNIKDLGCRQHLLQPWRSCLPCLKDSTICPGPISTCVQVNAVLKEC